MRQLALQRSVEFEVETADRQGRKWHTAQHLPAPLVKHQACCWTATMHCQTRTGHAEQNDARVGRPSADAVVLSSEHINLST